MIRPEALLEDRQRTAIKRLGLAKPVRVLEQPSEIVEVCRHFRMIRPVARLVDRQRAANKRLTAAGRFVTLSKSPRLLRSLATLG